MDNIKKEFKELRQRRFLAMWVIVIFLAIIIVISTVFFIKSLNERLYRERQSHLQEITVKVTEVLDTKIESLQNTAIATKRAISKKTSLSNKEQLFNLLDDTAYVCDVESNRLIAIDNDGKYYSSDGLTGIWTQLDDLVTMDPKPVIREISFDGVKASYMVFFAKLDKDIPLTSEGTNLIQTAVLVPFDSIVDIFTVSGFSGNCYTYLVNNDGRRLYRQTFSNDFIEEYNVLTSLESDSFKMGATIDELKDAVKQGEQLCVEFSRPTDDNEDYFVSTVPLTNSNWTVLLFVPTNVLSNNTSGIMKFVIIYFVGLAVLLIAIFGFLIYVVNKNKSDRKMLKQQEENNVLLAKAAEEANSANVAKSNFLSHMSHDIRTPINGIVGMTSIAMKNMDNTEKVADCLHKISGAADHLLTLINDVLDMSRIESGKVNISHEPMDIRTMVDNCYSIIGGQILSREITFQKEFKNIKHPHVLGDELHIRQILINILGNAVKFTPDGGTISFRVQEMTDDEEKATIRFEIEDNGIGMTEEFQKHIFEAFSQADNGSRTTFMGTGLGMAITKQFVDLMGGDIKIRSKLSEGSCFTVDLTLDVDPEKRQENAQAATDDVKGMNILLVEDNMLNMEIAEEILEDEGVTVATAENGQIAVDEFNDSEPGTFDAILMDIMMPVMNGYEATRAIRASSHPDAKVIPIIAMSANAYAEDVQEALASGMNAHVAKPINIPLLLSTLNRYRVQKN
jgi:signal transduction histidine kinase/ActR/RegA family two-component response regulator